MSRKLGSSIWTHKDQPTPRKEHNKAPHRESPQLTNLLNKTEIIWRQLQMDHLRNERTVRQRALLSAPGNASSQASLGAGTFQPAGRPAPPAPPIASHTLAMRHLLPFHASMQLEASMQGASPSSLPPLVFSQPAAPVAGPSTQWLSNVRPPSRVYPMIDPAILAMGPPSTAMGPPLTPGGRKVVQPPNRRGSARQAPGMGDRNDASRLSRRGSMSERRGDPSLTSEQEVMNAVASASSIGDMGPPLRPAGSAPAPAGLHPYFTEEIPSAPPATPRIPLSPKFERSATAFGDLLKAGSVRSVPKSAILRSQREESVSDEETYDSDKTVTASNWKKKGKGKKKKRETVVESIERRGKVKDSGRGGSDDGAKALPVM